MSLTKPQLSFSQIINMNVGFFGIQYSFGLQQTAIGPLYSFLGAKESELPLLFLAGPVTGLLIQPIIGAMSDKTWSPNTVEGNPFSSSAPFFVVFVYSPFHLARACGWRQVYCGL